MAPVTRQHAQKLDGFRSNGRAKRLMVVLGTLCPALGSTWCLVAHCIILKWISGFRCCYFCPSITHRSYDLSPRYSVSLAGMGIPRSFYNQAIRTGIPDSREASVGW